MKHSINIIAFLICALIVSNLNGQSAKSSSTTFFYNFYDEAQKADWKSTTIDSGKEHKLRFGEDHQSLGSARIVKKQMEDGKVRSVLHTHPKWTKKGIIEGIYPEIRDFPRESQFVGWIGFIKPNGTPKSDGARFSIYVKHYDRASRTKMEEEVFDFHKRYNGRMQKVVVDLSRFAGKSVGIILRVDTGSNATNTPTEDWAAWYAPALYSNVEHRYRHND